MADDDFKNRFSAARAHRRDVIEERGREVYKFCFNGREAEWDDRVKNNMDGEEIFSDFPATVAFAGEGEDRSLVVTNFALAEFSAMGTPAPALLKATWP